MNRLYLARHGETTWNVAGRYQGRMEAPLSPLGVAQGNALAEEFERRSRRGETVARILSSPLGRCTTTARYVADRLGLAVAVDERLIEIAHGTWEGRLRGELAANDAERYRAWRGAPERVAFEDGEDLTRVRARWRAFAGELTDCGTLVVTHDAVCRVALLDAMQRALPDFWAVHVENAAFAVLESGGAGPRVIQECYTAHLSRLRASLTEQAL